MGYIVKCWGAGVFICTSAEDISFWIVWFVIHKYMIRLDVSSCVSIYIMDL